jgi:NTP pyrophosphatase (non-canonical NTP hydrolase)
MQELIQKVEKWAEDKGLIDVELAPKQYLKVLEEIGETTRAILKNDKEGIVDGIGDICVTLIILAKQLDIKISDDSRTVFKGSSIDKPFFAATIFNSLFRSFSAGYINYDILAKVSEIAFSQGYTLEFCLESAWNEIKDRKGKLIDGTFVKDESRKK